MKRKCITFIFKRVIYKQIKLTELVPFNNISINPSFGSDEFMEIKRLLYNKLQRPEAYLTCITKILLLVLQNFSLSVIVSTFLSLSRV